MVNIEKLNKFTFNGGNIQRSGWPTWGVSTKSEFMSFCVIVKLTLATLLRPPKGWKGVPGGTRLSNKFKR